MGQDGLDMVRKRVERRKTARWRPREKRATIAGLAMMMMRMVGGRMMMATREGVMSGVEAVMIHGRGGKGTAADKWCRRRKI